MKTHRRVLSSIAAVAALCLGLSGCAGPQSPTTTPSSDTTTASTSSAPEVTTFNIGVAVYLAHPALEAVQAGFEEVLKEQGVDYTLDVQNAQGEASNAATIASSFASDQSIDLILAIATPMAVAMASAEKDRPILFSAVTDPVKDGLVPSWDKTGANITGTSDLNPGSNPLGLVKEAVPGAKTVGVLYSSSESNSLAQVDAFKEEASGLGVTLKTQAITSAAEVSVGLASLSGVDAILIPTDNVVVASIASVIGFGREKKIPVFCSDASTVELGTVASRTLSYHDLGRSTGEMAVAILRDGVPLTSIKPQAPAGKELSVNLEAAERYGLTLPDGFAEGAIIVKTKS